VSNGRLRISLVCCCNRFEVSALQECDATSLGNWFPTFRDNKGFESPRNWHNYPRRRDKYVGRQVPRDAASRSRRTEASRAPLRITCNLTRTATNHLFYLFVIISDQSNWCLGADLHILTALYTVQWPNVIKCMACELFRSSVLLNLVLNLLQTRRRQLLFLINESFVKITNI